MKKINILLKFSLLMASFPVLCLISKLPAETTLLPIKPSPVVTESEPAPAPSPADQTDTGYPGFINSRIIVINY